MLGQRHDRADRAERRRQRGRGRGGRRGRANVRRDDLHRDRAANRLASSCRPALIGESCSARCLDGCRGCRSGWASFSGPWRRPTSRLKPSAMAACRSGRSSSFWPPSPVSPARRGCPSARSGPIPSRAHSSWQRAARNRAAGARRRHRGGCRRRGSNPCLRRDHSRIDAIVFADGSGSGQAPRNRGPSGSGGQTKRAPGAGGSDHDHALRRTAAEQRWMIVAVVSKDGGPETRDLYSKRHHRRVVHGLATAAEGAHVALEPLEHRVDPLQVRFLEDRFQAFGPEHVSLIVFRSPPVHQ